MCLASSILRCAESVLKKAGAQFLSAWWALHEIAGEVMMPAEGKIMLVLSL